jgi:predicted dehydrogenase
MTVLQAARGRSEKPQSLHREVAVEAARAGKHIFCEKPPAAGGADARAMLENRNPDAW